MNPSFSLMHAAPADGGEGSSAPPAAAPPPASPAGQEGGGDVNWGEFADDSAESSPPAPEPPVAPPTKPAATPAPGTTPVQQPSVQAQPQAQPPAQPQVQPTQTQTPEQAADAAKAGREAMRTELAGIYDKELSAEDRDQLLVAPDKVISRLMAQAAVDGAQLAFQQFRHLLPHMIGQHTQQRETVGKVWTEFYAGHPDLSKPEYKPAIVAAINAVKAANPKGMDAKKAMTDVARTARAMLDLPPPGTPAGEGEPAAPVAPHTPVARGRAAPAAPSTTKTKPGEIDWSEFADATPE